MTRRIEMLSVVHLLYPLAYAGSKFGHIFFRYFQDTLPDKLELLLSVRYSRREWDNMPMHMGITLIAPQREKIHPLRTKLLPLGDDIVFICGHGPASTLGHERQTNPFIAGEAGS